MSNISLKCNEILATLQSLANPEKVKLKQHKFGIRANHSLGIYHQNLKKIAADIGYDNDLALALFDSGIYEARILCSKIYNPKNITEALMEKWVCTFENWEICDSFCMGFFAKSEFSLTKALQWSRHEDEFVKRAGFVIMASYGFANKKAANATFEQFFPIIEDQADDERIYVKKAVNWALRNIGKRNIDLHASAIVVARNMLHAKSKSAQWIASNALKEFANPQVNILNYPREIYRHKAN